MAGAEDFVQQLPEGMDTVVSDTFAPEADIARGLSDGEWNRLELARALMRLDSANLVVLDEPTRDMDSNEAVTFMHRIRSELGHEFGRNGSELGLHMVGSRSDTLERMLFKKCY